MIPKPQLKNFEQTSVYWMKPSEQLIFWKKKFSKLVSLNQMKDKKNINCLAVYIMLCVWWKMDFGDVLDIDKNRIISRSIWW